MSTLRRLGLMFLVLGVLAWGETLPSVHQIYQTAQSGELDKAHSMIEQVLKAHPNSAKAHFVDAEILARQGDMTAAKAELSTAEKLDPALSFAKPKTVAELKAHLSGSAKTGSSDQQVGSTSEDEKPFPWMMLLIVVGAVAVIVMLFKSRSRSNNNQAGYPQRQHPNSNDNNPYNNGSNMGGNGLGQGGGLGSTIMGGLAGGVAAGAGMVAGQALMNHFMDDDEPEASSHNESNTSYTPEPETSSWSDDSDFGVSDGDSWGDDSGGDSGDDSW